LSFLLGVTLLSPAAAAVAKSSMLKRSPCNSKPRSLPPRASPGSTTTFSMSFRIARRAAGACSLARCFPRSATAVV
jgi:hypothetical protein